MVDLWCNATHLIVIGVIVVVVVVIVFDTCGVVHSQAHVEHILPV